jgi:Protein of unknown function (DUF3991)/Toprim-like
MTAQTIREFWEALRSIPLSSVLEASGARPDRYDRKKWHTAQGIISITGMKFRNWSQNVGGGGAIDLVMHLHQLDFRAATLWLRRQQPAMPQYPEYHHPAQRFSWPRPDPFRLLAVKRYLVDHRALPRSLIYCLVASGDLYADCRGNAVFLLRGKDNQPVGAELRGTGALRWRGLAPGSRKDLGYFCCPRGSPATAIILCESAIDALSCSLLYPDCLAISTAGARAHPHWLSALLLAGGPVYCGFDGDTTGDATAQQMMSLYPAVQRLRPTQHDWNDVLKSRSDPTPMP